MSVLVSGSLAYDHIMDFPGLFKDHFMPEKLHNINVSFNIESHAEHFGGTGGNIAYTLALLGEKASIIAAVGDDFDRYKQHLDSAGVDTSRIRIEPKLETAFAYIITDKGDNQIAAFHPGASKEAYASDIPIEKDTIAIIAPGSLADMREFPEKFRKSGIRFMFDPGQVIPALTGAELINGMTGSHTVFANDYEFSLIELKTGLKIDDVVKLTKNLVITLGAQGSRLITSSGEKRVSAVPASTVSDPTGAGDAYRAGYIKGMILDLSAPQSAQIGSLCATYCVGSVGTQRHNFSLDEFKQKYEIAYGESLKI